MYLFIFLIIVLLLFEGIIIIIKNKLNIGVEGVLYTHVNKAHKWGEVLLVVLSLIFLGKITFIDSHPLKPHYSVVGLILLYGFRAFMEWKFEKDSKQYILSILTSSFLLIILLGVELFFS